MPFPANLQNVVNTYVSNHVGNDDFHKAYFWYISDETLRKRLEEEFKSARYIYKLLEGLQAKDWLLLAQVKIQILLYASIYEAVLYHVLLVEYSNDEVVKKMMVFQERTRINVSADIVEKIRQKYTPRGEITIYDTREAPIDERKIVFEDKAKAALEIGLIQQPIFDRIVQIFSMRNAIHLHAEIRRGVDFSIDKGIDAYWYLKGFSEQIGAKMEKDGIVTRN